MGSSSVDGSFILIQAADKL